MCCWQQTCLTGPRLAAAVFVALARLCAEQSVPVFAACRAFATGTSGRDVLYVP